MNICATFDNKQSFIVLCLHTVREPVSSDNITDTNQHNPTKIIDVCQGLKEILTLSPTQVNIAHVVKTP